MGRFRIGDRYDRFGKYSFENTGKIGENKSSEHTGYFGATCPYSKEAIIEITPELAKLEAIYGPIDIYNRIKVLLGSDFFNDMDGNLFISISGTVVPIPGGLVSHGSYFLEASYKGVWGLECVFPNCPHRIYTGKNYFLI